MRDPAPTLVFGLENLTELEAALRALDSGPPTVNAWRVAPHEVLTPHTVARPAHLPPARPKQPPAGEVEVEVEVDGCDVLDLYEPASGRHCAY